MDDLDRLHEELMQNSAFAAIWGEREPLVDAAISIALLRSRLGLSQRDLAKLAGMKQPEIARLESGKANPTWATLVQVFDALGAEVAVSVRDGAGKRSRIVMHAAKPAAAATEPAAGATPAVRPEPRRRTTGRAKQAVTA